MNRTQQSIGFGVPGSFPLPNAGQPGTAVQNNLKAHPASIIAMPSRQNPTNAVAPQLAGRK